MVLASNKWLNNGDDQKPSEVVTPQTNSVAAIPNSTHKQDQLKPNFMSTTKTTEQTVAEKDSLSGGGGGGEVQPSSESAMNSNDNQNDETTDAMNRRQEIEEQHKTLENILKAMASNENNSDYVINDEVLETARTLPNSIEPTEEEELENNNHLIPTTTDIDADHRTDSNINVLKNNESTIKGSDIVNLTTLDDNVMATLTGGGVVSSNKTDRKSFLNTLTNLNTAQTVVMNNANTLSLSSSSSSSSASSSSSLSNKPVNPVYALNTGGNIINSNLNPHIMNGDASVQCSATNGAQAKIVLNCEQNSHPFQTRTIFLTPNIECKVGRLIAKCKASESNAIFDCKVLSRNHAVLWYSDDGKFWVRDTKSSNGTFINEYKLGNDAAVLHYGDTVKFGVDVLENSRKEVHGCIIASVKLYLPDGRQAISSDNSSTQRSQYSGESRISFDDLHRLNVYMQETSQREKALKSKLYNIQNLLDATRKNSSTCWQAMISEDQLLHRIHSLEKKIQILEKNMPESALKNEIMKLIDDKSAYQHSAKEALRSVYLERCEAMQKLSKLESDFAASENEGQILREKISSTEEALQDASERLRLLEIESNEHRNERARQQLEAKLEFEEQIQELTEKLQQREDDCDALRIRIAEASSSSSSLQQKKKKQNRSAESHNDEDKLQKQAIENLDAVIAGMDMGDDDEEEDDDNDNDDEHISNDEDDDDEEDSVDEDVAAALQGKRQRHKAGDVFDFNGSHEKEEKTDKHRGGEEATIMKWLKNSDLKMKEGSMDIINAICNNESDSSDEQDAISPIAVDQDIMQRYARLEEKLNGLKYQIKHIEEDVKEYQMDKATESYDNDDYDINGESEDDDNKKGSNLQTKLKQNVSSLNEACEEIFESIQQLRGAIKQKEQVSPTSPMVTPQFQKLNTTNTTKSSVNITTLPEIDEVDDEHDSEDEEENGCYNDDKDGDVGVSRKTLTVKSVDTKDASNAIIAHLKSEIEELKMKLNERDLDSQHMMEMLQIECETHKTKVDELLKLIEEQQKILTAEQDTIKLPTVIDDLSNGDGASSDSGLFGIDKTTETTAAAAASSSQHQPVMDASINTSISGSISEIESSMVEHGAATVADFEQQMSDELITLNNSFVQREEELIAYKESLEQSQKENLQLRNDLQRLKEHQPERNAILLLLTFVPIGAVVIAVLAYLSFNYF